MGMQRLSAKGRKGLACFGIQQGGLGLEAGSVGVVAQQRVADVGEMDADLVGAAGLQPAGQQTRDRLAIDAEVFFQHFPMGYRLAAARPHSLFVPRYGMAVERCINGAFWALRHAPNESEVSTLQRA